MALAKPFEKHRRRMSASIMAGYLRPNAGGRSWRRFLRYGATIFAVFIYSFFILIIPPQLLPVFLLPMMALILLVIWALPVTERAPPKLLDTLFWLYFGSLFLWPNYLAITIPGLPWITIARLLTAPMVLILIWCASASRPFRDVMHKAYSAMPAMIYLIAIFSFIQVLSIAFSDLPFATINRVFTNMLTWTGLFFASLWVFRDARKIETVTLSYTVMAAILCIMTVFEAMNGGVLWAHSVPGFLKPPDPLIDEILSGSYRLTGQYRVQATQTTPLSLAELLALATPFLFYVVDKYRNFTVIALAVVLDGLIINTLLLADARLGFVALILAHLLALLFVGLRQWRGQSSSLVGPAISLLYPALITATILAVTLVGRIRTRVLGSGQHQGSNDARTEQARLAFQKIWESPFFGFGADRGGYKIGFYSPGGQLTVDSYFLSILMDYGFIGFFVFYGMLVFGIVKALRNMFAGRPYGELSVVFAIFLFQFLVIKSVLSQSANHPLLFIALAAVVSIQYHINRTVANSKTAIIPQ